jgi:hypothetical protein
LNAERRTPNAERRTPNAERRTPNAERRTPNAERRTPNAERRKLLTLSWGSTSINVWIRPACLCYLLLENSTLVNPYAVV